MTEQIKLFLESAGMRERESQPGTFDWHPVRGGAYSYICFDANTHYTMPGSTFAYQMGGRGGYHPGMTDPHLFAQAYIDAMREWAASDRAAGWNELASHIAARAMVAA